MCAWIILCAGRVRSWLAWNDRRVRALRRWFRRVRRGRRFGRITWRISFMDCGPVCTIFRLSWSTFRWHSDVDLDWCLHLRRSDRETTRSWRNGIWRRHRNAATTRNVLVLLRISCRSQSVRIGSAQRIIQHECVQVETASVADHVRLQEPSSHRRVVPGLEVVQSRFRVEALPLA